MCLHLDLGNSSKGDGICSALRVNSNCKWYIHGGAVLCGCNMGTLSLHVMRMQWQSYCGLLAYTAPSAYVVDGDQYF